jgi:hypothetical protein
MSASPPPGAPLSRMAGACRSTVVGQVGLGPALLLLGAVLSGVGSVIGAASDG